MHCTKKASMNSSKYFYKQIRDQRQHANVWLGIAIIHNQGFIQVNTKMTNAV